MQAAVIYHETKIRTYHSRTLRKKPIMRAILKKEDVIWDV